MSTEDNSINDDAIVEAVAPEQQQPHKWEFRPRQEPKWGIVTKQGLVVGRAPNQKVIPPDEVYYLATLGCTNREIADWFQISESTLKYNFDSYITKGKEEIKQKLRQAQIKTALSGNAALLIWLGKQLLSQSDNPGVGDDDKILPWNSNAEE